jgi:hypothetical protein
MHQLSNSAQSTQLRAIDRTEAERKRTAKKEKGKERKSYRSVLSERNENIAHQPIS